MPKNVAGRESQITIIEAKIRLKWRHLSSKSSTDWTFEVKPMHKKAVPIVDRVM